MNVEFTDNRGWPPVRMTSESESGMLSRVGKARIGHVGGRSREEDEP